MTKSLETLNSCIKDHRQTAIDLKDKDMDESKKMELIGDKLLKATLPLYDAYIDENAFVYVPYMFHYEELLTEEEGLTKIVYTINEDELPKLEHPDMETYKKVLFKNIVDFVYAGMETWNLTLNLGTFYCFELYDWQINYIMARKNGETEYVIKDEDGNVDKVVKW